MSLQVLVCTSASEVFLVVPQVLWHHVLLSHLEVLEVLACLVYPCTPAFHPLQDTPPSPPLLVYHLPLQLLVPPSHQVDQDTLPVHPCLEVLVHQLVQWVPQYQVHPELHLHHCDLGNLEDQEDQADHLHHPWT